MVRLYAAATLALVLLAGCSPSTNTELTADGYSRVVVGPMDLEWLIDGEEVRVRVGARTTGWVAVGFDPSQRMKDANIIIGYVKDGAAAARDDFGVGATSHAMDDTYGGTQDILDVAGVEEAGRTQLRFTIPLDSGDARDRPLARGKRHRVILAHGREGADDFSTGHTWRGSARLAF